MKKEIYKLILNLLLVFSGATVIYLFWENDVLAGLLVLLILIIFIFIFRPKRLWSSLFISLTLMQAGELLVNSRGAWTYHSQTFFTSPLYLFPTYCLGLLAVDRLSTNLLRLFSWPTKNRPKATSKEFILSLFFFFFYVFVLRYFWQRETAILILTSFMALIHLKLLNRQKSRLIFLLAATIGSGLDMIGTYFGAWSWGRDSLGGVSLWTPVMYGNTFIILDRLASFLAKEK